jgi:hypothetical protein
VESGGLYFNQVIFQSQRRKIISAYSRIRIDTLSVAKNVNLNEFRKNILIEKT